MFFTEEQLYIIFISLKFFQRCILGDWTRQLTYHIRGGSAYPSARPLRLLFIATNRPAITNPHRGEGWEVRQWVSHLGRKNSFTPFKRSFLPSMGNPLRICHITNSMPGRRKIIAGREETITQKKLKREASEYAEHPHFKHFKQPTPEPIILTARYQDKG